MSDKTAIEWTATRQPDGTVTPGATWNPIRGQNARHTCARISPGCDNCYAATMTRRGLMGTAALDYGVGETPNDPARLDEKALLQPLTWKKPRKIFVASMTDLFGTWVPDVWIDRIFAVMALVQQHTFIVLTKRPTRMRDYLDGISREQKIGRAAFPIADNNGIDWDYHWRKWHDGNLSTERWPLPNVWAGTTIESDQFAWRANRLRQTPAAVRWVSAEPLLSGLPSLDLTGIDWLVSGGESGPKARPSHPDWYRDLRDRCAASGTAYFFKQWGEWLPADYMDRTAEFGIRSDSGHVTNLARGLERVGAPATDDRGRPLWSAIKRVGNHKSGRLLDGMEHNDYPAAPVAREATL